MDVATAGVLRDITLWVWLSLLIGAAAYKWVRQSRPAAEWHLDGNVNVQSFWLIDALVVGAISMLLLGGLQKAGAGTAEPAAAEAANELTVVGMFVNLAVPLMACAVLLFYLRAIRDLNPVELFGLNKQRFISAVRYALLYMIPVFIIVLVVANVVALWMKGFWPDMSQQTAVEAFRKSNDPMAKALMVVAAGIVAPIVEETVFRGFVYGVIKRFSDRYFATLCSSILFAVVHLHMGSLVPLILLAVFFCIAYEHTGSLAVPMLMHAIFNGTSLALMIFFPDLTDGNAG